MSTSEFVILGDIHIGARGSSHVVCEYQIKWFEEELFPYLLKNDIKLILQLGDIFDVRKMTNHDILFKWKKRVFDWLDVHEIDFVNILGNHDVVYKNTLEISSTELFLSHYKNVTTISEPTEYTLLGSKFLLMPWICEDNRDATYALIESTDAIFAAGHLELGGFEFSKGIESHGAGDIKDFEKFDIVFSGHYHTRSEKENIAYTGTPYELTWVDYNDQKSFYVFNSSKQSFKRVNTKSTLHHRFEYDDSFDLPSDSLKDKFVKVVVNQKTDIDRFEKTIRKIVGQEPFDLKITDLISDFTSVELDDDIALDDTKTLAERFIEESDTELNKDNLKRMMISLYSEALEKI